MAYKKDNVQHNYDVFPLVFSVGKPSAVHIRPLHGRPNFNRDQEYIVDVFGMEDWSDISNFPSAQNHTRLFLKPNNEGGFDIPYTFSAEMQYSIIIKVTDGQPVLRFYVYAVNSDLAGRYPFLGDLHMHTCRSDGGQLPDVVCANYRMYGYDFTVISDHHRYYPSLEAIDAYKDVPLEFTIVPGEEVHLPAIHGKRNDVHIVNFGGEYSINGLIQDISYNEKGDDKKYRSLYGNAPDVMTVEEFACKMEALAAETKTPDGVDALPYAVCKWIFDEIRKAGGLGIYAHPNWITEAFQIPERFTDYMMEQHPFDAFEVLGGESYFEQNGYQTVRYYEEKAKGHRFPIVGSTDSHSSYPTNPNAYDAQTIIFSPENERTALISSVKNFYSVAIDSTNPDFRLVGESRFVRYGCFLLRQFFPLHDELCFEEGRLMRQYVVGDDNERAEASKGLAFINGRMKAQREKYFDF